MLWKMTVLVFLLLFILKLVQELLSNVIVFGLHHRYRLVYVMLIVKVLVAMVVVHVLVVFHRHHFLPFSSSTSSATTSGRLALQ